MMENADQEQKKLLHSRSSSPLPESQQALSHSPSCTSQALFSGRCRQSFNPRSHLEVENWGTERWRNSQGPSSCGWLLIPRSLLLPCAALPVTCRPTGPIFTPLFSAPPRQMFPLLKCSSQHSQLVALSLYSFSVPCFLLRKISQLSQFNIYDAYVCWLIYCLNYIMCYVLTRTHLFCSHTISNAKHNAWLQQTWKFSSNDW